MSRIADKAKAWLIAMTLLFTYANNLCDASFSLTLYIEACSISDAFFMIHFQLKLVAWLKVIN